MSYEKCGGGRRRIVNHKFEGRASKKIVDMSTVSA